MYFWHIPIFYQLQYHLKQKLSILLIVFLTITYLTSCDAVKRVSEDNHLLTNNNIIINDKKNNTEIINNLLHQKPNRKILGTPLRLHIYNSARPNKDSLFEAWLDKKPKRRERLKKIYSQKQVDKIKQNTLGFNNWLKTTGEAPVIVDERKTKKSVKRLQDYHINNGWFDAKTNYEIIRNNDKRAQINYNVKTGRAFIIDSISSKVFSPVVDSLYTSIKEESLIKPEEQYRTTNLTNERDRISNALRNSGVYHFNQDYITFEIDTIGTNKKVNIGMQIQNRAIKTIDSTIREPFEIYKIKDVNIITDYTFENRGKPFQDSVKYKNYTLYSYDKMKYRPKAITDAVFITPGTIFRDIDKTRTYRHLTELRSFKYPNIEYIENSEDRTLTDTIRLTPLKKFNLDFSSDIFQNDIQTIGFSVNPSLMIRNIFRGAETFEISGNASIGSLKDKNTNPDAPFFDVVEFGVDLKLTIPRIFSPFYTEKIIPKYMSPSTRISLSTTSQTNIGLDKETFSGTINYRWTPNDRTTNYLDLFNAQYVRNLNTSNYFNIYESAYDDLNEVAQDIGYTAIDLDIPNQTEEFIEYVLSTPTPTEVSNNQLITVNSIDERKQRLTEDNLIFSSAFSFTKDNRTNLVDQDFSIFKFKIESAGNLLSTVSNVLKLEKDTDDRYQIFNVAFSQYIKTELDYIKHWNLGKKNTLAIRNYFGIAIPYGNSTNIPFAKSFFAGGPNDNRAWNAYSLGPGSSQTNNEFNEANLKLALSIEQRFNLFENFNGAIFIDSGNIWNVLDDTTTEGAILKNISDLKNIAIGSGFGLRYDFSYVVFRFDIGFKTYDPSYGNSNRWFNDYNFGNAVYNIGINYPF